MKKNLLLLPILTALMFLTGCVTCDSEENIPIATLEQTAEVFNEVISRDNCDIVMCYLTGAVNK